MGSEDLRGKSALVTGGTSGIGEAAVRRLADAGASVTFTGRDTERGARVAAATGAVFAAHDVTDDATWPGLIADVQRRASRLDILFANAGTTEGDADIESVPAAAWRRVMEVNVTGVMLACQHAIAAMKQNPGGSSGSIIINSSVVAMQSLPGYIAYTTSKGALRSLAKGIAAHCARHKLDIRCNSIHPGNTDTPNLRRAVDASGDPAAAQAFLASFSPLERLANPEEVANLVLYLAGSQSSFITGAEILIDGGTIAGMGSV